MGSFDAAFPRPFGEYLLLQSFGRGGMGEVFLARRDHLGVTQLSVIKTLRRELADDAEYMGRFRDETRVAVQLRHANICQTFDAGSIDETPFIELEFISGVTLKSYLAQLEREKLPLNPSLAVHIGCELLEALAYAHRHEDPLTGQALHIVHRDVSPHNLMLSYEGEVKLIDFGLAQSSHKEENTASDIVLGKVAYMAPEQARGDEVTGAADQYAAAVLISEMLTGLRFFEQRSNQQIWNMVMDGSHRPRRFAELPEAVQEVLDRALSSQPSVRFESCDAFLDAFRDAAATVYPIASTSELRRSLRGLFAAQMAKQRALLIQQAKETSDAVEAAPGPTMPEHSTAQRTPVHVVDELSGNTPSPASRTAPRASPRASAAIQAALRPDDSVVQKALPRSRLGPRLAAAAAVCAVVGLAFWLGQHKTPAPEAPAPVVTAPVAGPPEDPGASPPAPPPPAPADEAPPTDDPPAPAPAAPAKPKRLAAAKRAAPEPAAPEPEPEPAPAPAAPAPVDPAPAPVRAPVKAAAAPVEVAPPPMPISEAVKIVKSCSLGGAKTVQRLIQRIPTGSLTKEQGRLVTFWARKCQAR